MLTQKILFPLLCLLLAQDPLLAADPDTPFIAPVSIQYTSDPSLAGTVFSKVVVDYEGNVHVLSDRGLCRIENGRLVRDLLYRPLAGKQPLDIAVSDSTGALYYLYENCFLSNTDAGKPYALLPKGRYLQLAVDANGDVLLAGNKALGYYHDGVLRSVPWNGGTIREIIAKNGHFYVRDEAGVYELNAGRIRRMAVATNLSDFVPAKKAVYLATQEGYWAVDAVTGDTTRSFLSAIPATGISALLIARGKLWAGTAKGVFSETAPGRFCYYASRRWLESDSVLSMATDRKGNIYALTPGGVNEIRFRPETLHAKAVYFENLIHKRHIRYGLLAEVRMEKPGDLSTAEMTDTDNDGLWSCFYLGSEAFRYAVTGSKEARRNAWECFAAYQRLVSITAVKGFPARTFERTGYKVSDPKAWRLSPDSGWEWKGTTSSDEFVGHIFAAAVMDAFVAKTPEEKKRVAAFIDAILTHIIQHHYNFVDADGKPTLWGRWSPDYLNGYPKTIGDRKLGSTTIIAGLELGYKLTGKALYKQEALRLMHQEGYLDNILIDLKSIRRTPGHLYQGHDMGGGGANHSDDEMTMLAYWVLYHDALDTTLRNKFAKAINNYWEVLRPEKNPLWNLITLGTTGSFDKAATLWYLREYPLDQIRWTIRNSTRKDLHHLPPNFRERYTRELLSPAEAPLHRYNANPFELDGGNGGKTELTGAEFLLPYWMGRYLGVIGKAEHHEISLYP